MIHEPVLNTGDPLGANAIIRRYKSSVQARVRELKRVTLRQFRSERAVPDSMFLNVRPLLVPSNVSRREAANRIEAWVRLAGDEVLLRRGLEEVEETYYADAARAVQRNAARFAVNAAGDAAPVRASTLLKLPSTRDAARELVKDQETRLSGFNRAMSKRARSIVADGWTKRQSRDEIANRLDRMFDVGLPRARTIAQTEIVRAHATSTLRFYRTMRFDRVSVQAEWTLNVHGSARPCPICVGLAGSVYTLAEAQGLIPIHPNCQCGWTPLV